jgi:S-DNA-T family DNA segregation ATPase FtsK/SpoIIIE
MATEAVRARSTPLAELLGVSLFAMSLMLVISLATYDPRDPVPFFKSGLQGDARNFIGPVGAFLAELFVAQFFGLAAAVLPFAIGFAGWRLFWCRPVAAPYTKGAGLVMLVAALTALFSLAVGTISIHGEPVRAGGAAGELVAAVLMSSVGRAGAYIVLLTAVAVSIILATQFSFATFLERAADVVGRRLAASRAAYDRYAEEREKERMRQEVARKQAAREAEREREAAREKELVPEAPPKLQKRAKAAGDPPAEVDELDDLLGDLPLNLLDGPPAAVTAPAPPVRKAKAKAAAEPPPPPADTPAPEPLPDETGILELPKKASPSPGSGKPLNVALPPTSILEAPKNDVSLDKSRLFDRARALQAKSGEFGVTGQVVEIHPGPVVTTYEFKPDAGIKYSKVVGLSDDLALGLEAESIRIDRMSGRGTVAIEIPNEVRETIYLREIIESDAFRKANSRLTMALGKTVSGETYVTDLATMPHLLIAGATGQGKSVGLNCMISSLLFKSSPEEVRLILIDPKRLELGVYEDIPHLLCPVVTDPKMAANVLKWAVGEMEKRIRRLASEGVRNIDQYNNVMRAGRAEKPEARADEDSGPLHYIVIIIDELADLMMVSSNEVEECITRLAQMARAVGIHLILATQRPSVDVITGLIKANFPSRISFRVSAKVDSRTILDAMGAEKLLGRGDMLFLPPGSSRLLRVHGAYVSEAEIARLTTYLRKTGKPEYDETVGKTEKSAADGGADTEERDELFDEAVRFVVQSGQASTSMLQRRFRIGFARAGRLIDLMERDGIISAADGSKSREILVPADYYETVDTWPK